MPTSDTPRSVKRPRLFKSSIIELVVGQKPEHHQIHENTLCADSPYFQRCILSAEIEESTTKTVKLPDVDSAMFEEIVRWMYDKTLHTYAKTSKAADLPAFIRFYILADKFEIEVLQNKIQVKIMGWLDTKKATPALLQIVPDGPLKNLVIDQLARDIVQRDFLNDALEGEAAKQLLVGGNKYAIDILNSMAKITKKNVQMKKESRMDSTSCFTQMSFKEAVEKHGPKSPGDRSRCTYHKHVHTKYTTDLSDMRDC